MKLTLESTDKLTDVDGVRVRVWHGVTERGTRCLVFIHRIAVHVDADAAQFDAELHETLPPGTVIPHRFLMDDEEEWSAGGSRG